MINLDEFYNLMLSNGVEFYTGVPDSLLANFCAYIDYQKNSSHIIAANEGNAIAIAMGYHLSTRKIAAVYMQNSGLGNAINPLVSLAHKDVYKIPMLLIIGWRGEPGIVDEPQHIRQGQITLEQLNLLEIPYWIIDSSSEIQEISKKVFEFINKNNTAAAIVVRKNTFQDFKKKSERNISSLFRERALEKLLNLIDNDDLIVATTGVTSREIFEIKEKKMLKHNEFLTVGGMGHAASIALGVSIGKPNRRVICFDGDGSLLMHMGSMPVISNIQPKNFVHILLNNGTHESVGGQPTSANQINFKKLTLSVGYKKYLFADDLDSIDSSWNYIVNVSDGPTMFEIKIQNGSRKDLGRPTKSPQENKHFFMKAADDY